MITLNVLDKDGNAVVTNPLDGSLLEPLLTAALASPSLAVGFTTGTHQVAKNSAGKLFAVRATNVNAGLRYLQVHNAAAALTSGTTVPLLSVPIAAGTATVPAREELTRTLFGPVGLALSTGVTLAVSTTPAVYTAATAADHTLVTLYA